MELRFQEWIPDLFGLQSMVQYGVQPAQYQSVDDNPVGCSAMLDPTPPGYEAVSMAVVRSNLAVMPAEWSSSGVGKPWSSVETHSDLDECLAKIAGTSFTVFHPDFLDFIGPEAKLETIHQFSGVDAEHVHEAPAFIPATNELLFADTSVIGWLWALEVDTHQIRKVNTSPPLPNVNGATTLNSRVYLTTNGGPTPGIWNCTSPTPSSRSTSSSTTPETLTCIPLVNNYRLQHLNSPNDLIFTPDGQTILFTDPTYGYDQAWPGVPPPELPTSIYHFHPATGRLHPLENAQINQPNGLALSTSATTLYVADSNSTSGRPIGVWPHSVRNVYAFDISSSGHLSYPRLIHVVESGWPDGLRVTSHGDTDVLLVASMGGVDVVDVADGTGPGVLLGKLNVGDDIVFNLERVATEGRGQTWLLTGKKAVYRVTLRSR